MSPATGDNCGQGGPVPTPVTPDDPRLRDPLTRHPRLPTQEGAPVEALLEDLVTIAGELEGAEHRLRRHVQLLRRRRVTWAEIGRALNVSRQAAWQRFGGRPDRRA